MDRRGFLLSGLLAALAPVATAVAAPAAAASGTSTEPAPAPGSVPVDPYTGGDPNGPNGANPTRGLPDFTRPAIFYAPHADDETISMGLDIGNHLHAGRDVVLVLMTLGCSPGMLAVLNGAAPDRLMNRTHDPLAEGYLGPLAGGSLAASTVAASRAGEYRAAAAAFADFGRASGRGRLAVSVVGLAEGLSLFDAMPVIEQFENRYPGASHKTTSWTDAHPDHTACGAALSRLAGNRVVSDARYYVQPGHQQAAAAAAPSSVSSSPVRPAPVRPSPGVVAAVARASAAYQVWNPAAGAYAFGYHSVPGLFDAVARTPVGWVHR